MTHNRISFLLAVAGLLVGVQAPSYAQVTLGQVDDFQDGSTQGWVAGGALSADITPANINDSLRLATSGSSFGAGNALIVFNTAQWIGDYTAAGVLGIEIDIDNPNDADVNIRLGLLGGGGGFVTNDVVVPANSSVDAAFFELSADNLIDLGGGGGNVAATLANVFELRLVHNPDVFSAQNGNTGAAPIGSPPFAASVFFDNITAVGVPEPSSVALLVLSGVAFGFSRRKG